MCWRSSVIYWTLYSKLKAEWLPVDGLFAHVITWLSRNCSSQQRPGIKTEHSTTHLWPRKGQNWKQEVWLMVPAYCFRIIVKSKNCKSSHSIRDCLYRSWVIQAITESFHKYYFWRLRGWTKLFNTPILLETAFEGRWLIRITNLMGTIPCRRSWLIYKEKDLILHRWAKSLYMYVHRHNSVFFS